MRLQGAVTGKKRPADSQAPAQVSDSESDSEGSDDEGGDGKGRGKLRTRQKEAARRKAEQEIRKREVRGLFDSCSWLTAGAERCMASYSGCSG